MMERDPYLGRIVTGRIASGVVRVNDRIHGLRERNSQSEAFDVGKVSRECGISALSYEQGRWSPYVLLEFTGCGWC